ncbi:cyclin-U2-2 [Cladophialophora carrionii]|uniref:Cyclin-U2-2 n=1 Tax=Cladophialophora carrionii TaxID=86049 RepID=A0A1C1CK73_9EURO|nr:cyclin-U2-2 [Cladophialophora carrionii]
MAGLEDRGDLQEQATGTTSSPKLPAPPEPENDKGIIPPIKSPLLEGLDDITPENVDIFNLEAVSALKLLCRSIDTLVQLTGDVPPTPPARSRGGSPARSLSRLRESMTADAYALTPKKENVGLQPLGSTPRHEHIDGVPFVKTPIGSPEAHEHEPTSAANIVGAGAQPLYVQHGALARKFYSKRPPPISTEDYLMRMHKYCPMSTAVYLAASLYITRLAIQEKVLPVTPRNVHRLLLACLRVAMKALEDLSWPHARFSKVGGVSEGELGRLEITFCYLMDFSLKVDSAMLQNEAESLCRPNRYDSVIFDSPISRFDLLLPDDAADRRSRGAEKRKASSTLPSRPVVQVSGGIEVMGQS